MFTILSAQIEPFFLRSQKSEYSETNPWSLGLCAYRYEVLSLVVFCMFSMQMMFELSTKFAWNVNSAWWKLSWQPLWTYGHNHFSNVGDYQIRSGELLIRQPGFEASSMLRCCLFDASMQGTERKKVRDDPFKRICAAFVTNLYQKRNGSGINFFKVQHSYHSVWKSIEKSHFYNFASELRLLWN